MLAREHIRQLDALSPVEIAIAIDQDPAFELPRGCHSRDERMAEARAISIASLRSTDARESRSVTTHGRSAPLPPAWKCSKCESVQTDVIHTANEPRTVRRRRECLGCGHRWWTVEMTSP